MLSLLKYLYYGKKVELADDLDDLNDDPVIVDPYNTVNPIETINTKISNVDTPYQNNTVKPIRPTMRKVLDVNYLYKKNTLTHEILNKLNTNVVYLVLKKSTSEPLGIYDSLAKAKEHGQKSTYHNCSILEYKINDSCKYLKSPVFENS